MKAVLSVCVTVFLAVSPVFGQGGMIALFGDPGGADCAIYDTQPNSLVEVYVLHLFAPAVMSSAFSVPIPDCAVGLVWLADARVFDYTYGFSPTGVSVVYRQGDEICRTSPIHFLTIQYWAQGSSESCCALNVDVDPRESPPGIYAILCDEDFTMVTATGASAMINPNETCPCFNVPAEKSTWGKVKALYLDREY